MAGVNDTLIHHLSPLSPYPQHSTFPIALHVQLSHLVKMPRGRAGAVWPMLVQKSLKKTKKLEVYQVGVLRRCGCGELWVTGVVGGWLDAESLSKRRQTATGP